MKFVIQVVENASVRVVEEADGTVPEGGGYISGSIGRGFMVLVGISGSDTEAIADKMVEKMRKLRIFEDENGKTNLDLAAVGGEVLLVSQFTDLYYYIDANNIYHRNEVYALSYLLPAATSGWTSICWSAPGTA